MPGRRFVRTVASGNEEIAMNDIEPRGSWLSAATYDLALRGAEKAGMAERRRQLVEHARGAVLEIGAGTGLNLAYYPAGLDRLVVCEPEPHMFKHLRKRAEKLGSSAELIQATAEELPFEDSSFDTVVGTLVLCTVGDPRRALAEICCSSSTCALTVRGWLAGRTVSAGRGARSPMAAVATSRRWTCCATPASR
jgi:SAM-dependent methyltransferase